MHTIITRIAIATLALMLAGTAFAQTGYKPKTSQHASFNPANFERLAVIVKPIEQQQRFYMGGQRGQQTQTERMMEQQFLRTLVADGYTLVSRADLDAAMVEKGLDQAHMTDEKYTEEAGKLLHVSALLVVSIDAFKTTPLRTQRTPGYNAYANTQQYYQIDDNMVLWTGDLTVDQNINTQDEDSIVLQAMAVALAKSFPAFTVKQATP
jgi:hypothetical protein